MPPMEHLFLRACRRQPVERTPVWMMRQAGRYLPQYQAVRSKVSFLELCKTPELACEVTLQPIDIFGFDAAILFCDILIPLEGMGLTVEFGDKGPEIGNVVRTRADVERLARPDPSESVPFVLDAVRTIRKALSGRVPLIGFAGAPFTLMTYSVEGKGSKSWEKTKQMLFSEPETAHALLDKLADMCSDYLAAQIEAGAEAVQLFDSWAGILAPPDFSEFALRYARRVVDGVRASAAWKQSGGVPIIYFVNGCAPYLEQLTGCGADVLGVDWRVDLGHVRRVVGDGVALQGNMDPTALFAPPERIRERVRAVLDAHGPGPGHIFNLGHGVLPDTDPTVLTRVVELVHSLG